MALMGERNCARKSLLGIKFKRELYSRWEFISCLNCELRHFRAIAAAKNPRRTRYELWTMLFSSGGTVRHISTVQIMCTHYYFKKQNRHRARTQPFSRTKSPNSSCKIHVAKSKKRSSIFYARSLISVSASRCTCVHCGCHCIGLCERVVEGKYILFLDTMLQPDSFVNRT